MNDTFYMAVSAPLCAIYPIVVVKEGTFLTIKEDLYLCR